MMMIQSKIFLNGIYGLKIAVMNIMKFLILHYQAIKAYIIHHTGHKNYIGIGPSAHSYIHPCRLWNTSSLRTYNSIIKNDKLDFQYEILNEKNIFNEYIMTRLRLKEGVDLADLTNRFNKNSSIFHRSIRQNT